MTAMTSGTGERPLIVDGLQYCNWSPEIFEEMRAGGVSCVHVTICYWENLRETIANVRSATPAPGLCPDEASRGIELAQENVIAAV